MNYNTETRALQFDNGSMTLILPQLFSTTKTNVFKALKDIDSTEPEAYKGIFDFIESSKDEFAKARFTPIQMVADFFKKNPKCKERAKEYVSDIDSKLDEVEETFKLKKSSFYVLHFNKSNNSWTPSLTEGFEVLNIPCSNIGMHYRDTEDVWVVDDLTVGGSIFLGNKKESKNKVIERMLNGDTLSRMDEIRKSDKYKALLNKFNSEVEKIKNPSATADIIKPTVKHNETVKEDKQKESTVKKADKKPKKSKDKKPAAKADKVKTDNKSVDFNIKPGTYKGAIEVYFEKKPNVEILTALKSKGFRWNQKKVCWYGFNEEAEIRKLIVGIA